MQTLKLSNETALKLYPSAPAEFKATLEESFGKEFFSQKITDRVKTFEDACKILHVDPNDVLPPRVGKVMESDLASIAAYTKLIFIARALNEGWQPDWKNSSQYKYVPWFRSDKNSNAGSALSYDGADGWAADTAVGSRLCYKSREVAAYAAKQFKKLYDQYFLIA